MDPGTPGGFADGLASVRVTQGPQPDPSRKLGLAKMVSENQQSGQVSWVHPHGDFMGYFDEFFHGIYNQLQSMVGLYTQSLGDGNNQ